MQKEQLRNRHLFAYYFVHLIKAGGTLARTRGRELRLKIFVGELEGKRPLGGDVRIEKMILKCVFNKQRIKV